MFKVGDYIMKPRSGVCRVEDIIYLDLDGVDRNRLYYLLKPLNDENGTIYLPVDANEQQIRKVMNPNEVYDLIAKIPEIEEFNFPNDKIREQTYKEIIKNNEPESLLRMLKTTYLRKMDRQERGLKSTAADEYYMGIAEKYLFSELCFVLKREKEEIQNLIIDAL